ncbi:surface lipoprotein assembly modifier [Glaesserella sp.]|uniref:surface lipoprotein assembly modifier n=1 Tax=Glaesserella sp. TaxID=2094731 RepID=UPI0035A1D1BD
MDYKILFSTVTMGLSVSVAANQEQQIIAERLNDQRIQTENTVTQIPPVAAPKKEGEGKKENAQTISMTKEELVNHPDLVVRALIPALQQGNGDNVELLYPIYQKIPTQYHLPIFNKWSEAILAKRARDYTMSIRLYREILAENANMAEVRFQLAVVLFENNELEAAEDQFKKLRSEVKSPQDQAFLDQFLEAITRKDRWTFNAGLTYLNDPNINNAPKAGTRYGNWMAPKRESAEGLGFNINIGKEWSWGNGFFNELRLNSNGKYYWDNKKFNEITGRGSLGVGFQNAKTTLVLLPFIEQTLYAGGSRQSDTLKRFSKAGGAGLESSYWLTPKWQLNGNYEYAEQRYTTRKHLNGNYHFVSAGVVYLASAKQYWFMNLSYNRTATRDRDDSFFRRGVNFGWGQEWSKGLSTRFSISLAQKRYKAPMPIFGITQRNKEYGFQASVWHRAIHWQGITPRLTYHFNRTRSNHVFYSYDKHRVFLELSKQF